MIESGKKKKVKWASIKQVKFTFEQPELIFLKYNYEDDINVNFRTTTSKTWNTKNKLVKNKNCFYEKPVGILKKKKDDLMKLCKKVTPQNIMASMKIWNVTMKMIKVMMFLPFKYFTLSLCC